MPLALGSLVLGIGHVNNIPTMQLFHKNFQKYSVRIIYAIIDRVCLGIRK